jgi:hypothetical protein
LNLIVAVTEPLVASLQAGEYLIDPVATLAAPKQLTIPVPVVVAQADSTPTGATLIKIGTLNRATPTTIFRGLMSATFPAGNELPHARHIVPWCRRTSNCH